MLEEVVVTCPACWEQITLDVDLSAGDGQVYAEDCPVCCRPMTVRVAVHGEGCEVTVEAESD